MNESTALNLEKTLYTTSKPDAVAHNCVVAFDHKHAVSFRHGPHSLFQRGEKVLLYNVKDPAAQVETVVSAISDTYDLVVFELLNGEFENCPLALGAMFCGQSYKQLGISPNRQPTWKDGTVLEKHVGFYVGTSHGKLGDSGSGIFADFGHMLGVSIGKKNFADRHNMTIGEVADHHPDTQIISTDSILGMSDIVGSDFEPPEKKHASDTK